MYLMKVLRGAQVGTGALCGAVVFTSTCLTSAAVSISTASILALSIAPSAVNAQSAPACSSAASDSDGDGWGWENNRSCVVGSNSNSASTSNSSATSSNSRSGTPVCSSSGVDPDGDGWGWENNRSCRVSSGSAQTSNNQSSGNQSGSVASASDRPVCRTDASDEDNDGYGFENGVSCIVTSATTSGSNSSSVAVTGNAPPPVAAATAGFSNGNPVCLTDASDSGNNGFGYENNRTCVVVPGRTATRNQPLLNQRSCIDWLEIGYGNFRLQNNVWNASAVFNNNWSQCIELTGRPGNYVAKWDYNWRPRNEGNEFAVKSYPQVYYGRKTQYNLSGSVQETGLPVSVNNMPRFTVEYDYSETGIVERNVAFESFFHTSSAAEEHNKQYEMMVWVASPTIRTPGTQVTTVTLSGQEWDVYINPALPWAYVAFVARRESNRGTLNWNDFVNWSRDVGPSFGVPRMAPNVFMGAIELGTETFWGTGTFTLNRLRINGDG